MLTPYFQIIVDHDLLQPCIILPSLNVFPIQARKEGVLLDLRDFWPVLRVWVSEFLDEVLELVRDLMVGWEL